MTPNRQLVTSLLQTHAHSHRILHGQPGELIGLLGSNVSKGYDTGSGRPTRHCHLDLCLNSGTRFGSGIAKIVSSILFIRLVS